MPNWCENELTVSGPHGDREAFIQGSAGENGDLDFNTAIEYPREYADLDDLCNLCESDKKTPEKMMLIIRDRPRHDGFNSGGYEWRCQNWGTKWNASEIKPSHSQVRAFYSFNTAWAPPGKVILAWSHKYPRLTFTIRYWEGGGGFRGKAMFKNGQILCDERKSYRGSRGG